MLPPAPQLQLILPLAATWLLATGSPGPTAVPHKREAAAAQEPSTARVPQAIGEAYDEAAALLFDAYLEPFAEAGHLSCSILVAREGEVIYERQFGLADRELEVPIGPETTFCIASVSKPITIMLGTQLAEAGKLQPESKLKHWLPDFPRADEISVSHLFSHRAGIPHRVLDELEETQPKSAAEMVAAAAQHELLFDPGTQSIYSSGGYAVLARVLELAGGKSYAQLLDELVVQPAGAERTLHPDARRLVPGRAQCYSWATDGFVRAPFKDYAFLVGGGSIYSNPRDLHRIVRALLDGKLGGGARASLVRGGRLSWNGSTNAFRCFVEYDESSGIEVIYAANIQTGAADLIRRDFPRLLNGDAVEAVQVPVVTGVEVASEILARYVGTYRLRPGSEMDLDVREGRVTLGDWSLIPVSETTFYSPQDFAHVDVKLDDNGHAQALSWRRPGEDRPTRMPRVDGLGELGGDHGPEEGD